jgi:CTP synthase
VVTIYEIPLRFRDQGFDRVVCERLRLETKEPDLTAWKAIVERIVHPKHQVRIAVVGKYTDLHDAYKSVQEALIHGGIGNDSGVEILWMGSDQLPIRRRRDGC